jgi:hypothetical protein
LCILVASVDYRDMGAIVCKVNCMVVPLSTAADHFATLSAAPTCNLALQVLTFLLLLLLLPIVGRRAARLATSRAI